jgi:hypothetical protein
MNFILDELNNTQMIVKGPYSESRLAKKLALESIKSIFTSNIEFEKLINFNQSYYFNNEKLF